MALWLEGRLVGIAFAERQNFKGGNFADRAV